MLGIILPFVIIEFIKKIIQVEYCNRIGNYMWILVEIGFILHMSKSY